MLGNYLRPLGSYSVSVVFISFCNNSSVTKTIYNNSGWWDDERMMNWKGFGRKWTWHNFQVLSRHSPRGTKENHETPQSG
jgi:hypothetical protein